LNHQGHLQSRNPTQIEEILFQAPPDNFDRPSVGDLCPVDDRVVDFTPQVRFGARNGQNQNRKREEPRRGFPRSQNNLRCDES
jgi:hypothetical protein